MVEFNNDNDNDDDHLEHDLVLGLLAGATLLLDYGILLLRTSLLAPGVNICQYLPENSKKNMFFCLKNAHFFSIAKYSSCLTQPHSQPPVCLAPDVTRR